MVVVSPICAHHKMSQPHHKPVHPTSLHPPSNPQQNALAPARCHYIPNTISLQTIPQSHTCGTAKASVSYKHSIDPSTHLSSPRTQFHKYGTPYSRHSTARTNHTPHAHPTHSSTSQPIQRPQLHATSGNNATRIRAPTIIPSTHKRRHTTRARTPPAATMTTPALSPDTATGASRCAVVVSPICAHHKASQPHNKPVTPIIAAPPPPPLNKTRPCTCPYSFSPQHFNSPDDPAIAHVWNCKRACQLQTLKRNPVRPSPRLTPNSTNTAHRTHATASLTPITHRTHTLRTH